MQINFFSRSFIVILLSINISLAQSPYKIGLNKEVFIGGIGAASSIGALIIDSQIEPLSIEEVNKFKSEEINWFDRSAAFNWSEDFSLASDILVSLSAAVPAMLFTSEKIRKDFLIISTMYLETIMYSFALPYIAKGSLQRIRPYVYNNNASIKEKLSPDAKKSFFSGHTTVAFSSAVFLSTVYSDYFPDSKYKPFVWAGSLLIAALTGYSRYEAGKHFLTDIITGAIVGSAIGYFVPFIHKQNSERLDINATQTNRSLVLSFSYRF